MSEWRDYLEFKAEYEALEPENKGGSLSPFRFTYTTGISHPVSIGDPMLTG